MIRYLAIGAMAAVAMPAASGQYMKYDDIKGEAAKTGCPDDSVADKGDASPTPAARGGVQVAVGDVTGDGRAERKGPTKIDALTVKQKAAADPCTRATPVPAPRPKRTPTVRQ